MPGRTLQRNCFLDYQIKFNVHVQYTIVPCVIKGAMTEPCTHTPGELISIEVAASTPHAVHPQIAKCMHAQTPTYTHMVDDENNTSTVLYDV